jgi:hypothetical protein
LGCGGGDNTFRILRMRRYYSTGIKKCKYGLNLNVEDANIETRQKEGKEER